MRLGSADDGKSEASRWCRRNCVIVEVETDTAHYLTEHS
jgi:hypothetical protein